MSITKNYVNEMLRIVLVLSTLLSAASAVDCNGKSFHCVNSTHFMICVDLGGGVSQAIDDFFIACPPPTACQGTNHFECEFPAPTTAATTLNNVISETTLPWEEVVTASSLGNATKQFSENYINTEKITTTAEYSVTTDATVDWTAINAETATTAIETNQTVNENVNTTEYVPTVVAVDITTVVTENVSQTTTESQHLTETDPVVVDDITATAVETTTENMIMTDTIAAEIENMTPSTTEQVVQTINENLNITETVRTGVENVTQTTMESKDLTETEPVVVDNITATIVETVTENIIITDTTATNIDYTAVSATEQVTPTINENLNITETVPTAVENVTQSTTESKNLKETEPLVVDDIIVTTVETTTQNITITETIAAEIDYITPSTTEQVPETINENLNITETVPTGVENVTQTNTETKNSTETESVVVDVIPATALETTTENIIIADTLAAENDYIVPSVTDHTIGVNKDITTIIIQTTPKIGILTQTEHVQTYEITATTIETTTSNIIAADSLGTELGYIEPTATEQVIQNTNDNMLELDTVQSSTSLISIIEEILTTDTTQNIVTENITSPSQALNLETINTDALLTTDNNALSMPPAFEDNMKFEILMPVTENIVSTVNNGASTNSLITVQSVDMDTITTEAVTIPATISNDQPKSPEVMKTEPSLGDGARATEDIASTVNNKYDTNNFMTPQTLDLGIITTDATFMSTTISNGQALAFEDITTGVQLPATENILSSANNEGSTHSLATVKAGNVATINTEAMHIPTTVHSAPPLAPAFEDNMNTDVPLPTNENMASSVNNGISSNGFMPTQAVNVDIMDTDTMYIPTAINNAPPMAPTLGDKTRIETPLSAPKNIIFPKKYEDSTNGFMITNPMDLEHITQKAELETVVKLTTDKYVVPSKNIVVNVDITTKEIVGSVPLIIKESPNTINQKTQIILNSSTDTSVKSDAIESDVNGNNNDNKMTSIDTNNMFEIGEQLVINNIPNSTVDSGLDKSISHVSKTGAGNTDNSLFPNAHYNQSEVTSAINEVTHSNGKPTAENVNEKPTVNNVANSQTGALPISINGNIVKVTTTQSIPTSGFDSAFDISNQNWMRQQGESRTKQATNNLQQSIVELNDQTDNIIWNPLANQVFNNPNQNPESLGTSSVTNINDNTNDRNAASLNSHSEIPVNLNPVDFATAGIGVSSVPTTLPAKTSGADITIEGNTKNTYRPIENSVNPPSVVEADSNKKSQENMQAISNHDPSIASISITSDIKPEVKSSIVKDGNSDSPTVVHNNLPSQSITSQLELPTNTHSFPEASSIGAPMEGNKVIKEDDTISKTVILDLLPLTINNIKFSAHAATKPVSLDLNGGDITPVPTIRDPAFNFQLGITTRTTGTTIVPTVGVPTSNSQTSGFAKTVSSAPLNSQTRVSVDADVSSQPSQHVEKIPNKMARAPNNADVVPRQKPSGSGIITNKPDNLHSPNSFNNVKTGIITPESVSESNYVSPKFENILPHDPVIGYQKNNTTVVAGLNFVSQNVSFGIEKAPPNSTGSDHIQTQRSNPSTNNTSSIFTPAQKISTSTARTPSQMATSNPISHINKHLAKQAPTVAARAFSCIYGIRGRYSDKVDCRKFYICIGNNEPVVGYCPENTVFSDLKKLCTKHMSHCIRENQFKCPSVGRFSDFMKHNVYYICVYHKNNLYRFKFQCQKGYILDKTTVKCIETKEIESNESVSISSDNSSQTRSSAISSSTSISNSRSTRKSSSRADDSSSKNVKSRKSKKNNEAQETSEKSERKDEDRDDEVFKCKERGKFPIRNECRRYYLCKKGRRSEYRRKIKKCDSDEVFHKNKKKCVDEDSYEC